jgi:hypothetical protein
LAASVGAACILLIVQIGLLWRNLSVARTLERAETRIGHLADALALLTETSESGFRTMAAEIERLADAGGRKVGGRVNLARLAAAARRGQSVSEIAAAEGVSEGEVSLRLHLVGQRSARVGGRSQPHTPRGTADGAVRTD